jgi:hypothetical protein
VTKAEFKKLDKLAGLHQDLLMGAALGVLREGLVVMVIVSDGRAKHLTMHSTRTRDVSGKATKRVLSRALRLEKKCTKKPRRKT